MSCRVFIITKVAGHERSRALSEVVIGGSVLSGEFFESPRSLSEMPSVLASPKTVSAQNAVFLQGTARFHSRYGAEPVVEWITAAHVPNPALPDR